MQRFNSLAYGPAVAALLKDAKLNGLGPGSPALSMREQLAALTLETLAAPHALANRDMALACISGLWLRHDFLDESHRISQDLENPSGSYWHAIMHRREHDFSNAKYWFRRVGAHRVFKPLWEAARDMAVDAIAAEGGTAKRAEFLITQSAWDPFKFVDLCEMSFDGSEPIRALCVEIQQCEWQLLFDDCYRQVIEK
jgi:hypothetical protein